MKIALDIDEVLADTLRVHIDRHNRLYGTKFRREDFFTYEWEKIFGGTCKETIKEFYDFMDERVRIPIMRGAREGVGKLSEKHDIVSVTSRQYDFEDATRNWIRIISTG